MPFSREERETPEFIPHLLWPLNSPDLNSVDDNVWARTLPEKVYETRVTDLDDFNHHTRTDWAKVAVITAAVCTSVASSSLSVRQDRQWLYRRLF